MYSGTIYNNNSNNMYLHNGFIFSIRWIASSSVFFVGSVSVLTWIAMYSTQREMYAPIPEPSWNSVALAYGLLAFQVWVLFN